LNEFTRTINAISLEIISKMKIPKRCKKCQIELPNGIYDSSYCPFCSDLDNVV